MAKLIAEGSPAPEISGSAGPKKKVEKAKQKKTQKAKKEGKSTGEGEEVGCGEAQVAAQDKRPKRSGAEKVKKAEDDEGMKTTDCGVKKVKKTRKVIKKLAGKRGADHSAAVDLLLRASSAAKAARQTAGEESEEEAPMPDLPPARPGLGADVKAEDATGEPSDSDEAEDGDLQQADVVRAPMFSERTEANGDDEDFFDTVAEEMDDRGVALWLQPAERLRRVL